jgi:hypothetical protein
MSDDNLVHVQAWAAWHPKKGFGKTPNAFCDLDEAIDAVTVARIMDDSLLWKAVRVEIRKVE